jgi:hypothetical protein
MMDGLILKVSKMKKVQIQHPIILAVQRLRLAPRVAHSLLQRQTSGSTVEGVVLRSHVRWLPLLGKP